MVRSLISFGMLPWSRSSMLSQPTKHGTLSHLPTPTSSLANGYTKTHTTPMAPWLSTTHTVFCVVSHSNLALITMRLSTLPSNQRQSKQLLTYAPTRCKEHLSQWHPSRNGVLSATFGFIDPANPHHVYCLNKSFDDLKRAPHA